MSRSFVIVGAGQCGATAALTLRDSGINHRIVLLGDEPIAPYERPPLSKAVLLDDSPRPSWSYPLRTYEEKDIDCHFNVRATAIDTHNRILRTTAGDIAFERLLLATGGSARKPALAGAGDEDIHTIRSWRDAERLRTAMSAASHLTVIGGGLIGLEVAAAARQRGLQVTVVEAYDRLLSRIVPVPVSEYLLRLHSQRGVEVFLGQKLESAAPSEGRWRVTSDGGNRWVTDVLVAGVGLEVGEELAATAGCDVNDGVLVDDHGETTKRHIFAAGDCARFWHPVPGQYLRWENWQHAVKHGVHVARCMAGCGEPYDEASWGWTDQFGVTMQVAGNPLSGTQIVLREARRGQTVWCAIHRERLMGAVGIDAPREMRAITKLIRKQAAIDVDAIQDVRRPVRTCLATSSASAAD